MSEHCIGDTCQQRALTPPPKRECLRCLRVRDATIFGNVDPAERLLQQPLHLFPQHVQLWPRLKLLPVEIFTRLQQRLILVRGEDCVWPRRFHCLCDCALADPERPPDIVRPRIKAEGCPVLVDPDSIDRRRHDVEALTHERHGERLAPVIEVFSRPSEDGIAVSEELIYVSDERDKVRLLLRLPLIEMGCDEERPGIPQEPCSQ